MPNLLIVDDEEAICWGLTRIGEELGCAVATAASAEEALTLVRRQAFDAIVLDVRMPGLSGLEAMPQLRSIGGAAPLILMTAYGDLQTAVEAVRQGAFEYVVKPFDRESIRAVLRRALAQPAAASRRDPPPTQSAQPVAGFVGNSPGLQQVFSQVALAAASEANILIWGESGSGKELVAGAIHRYSQRSRGPFIPAHLASFSPALIESELFGHVRGAFTGAEQARPGLLVQADGGTLFLDEVAEISLPIQVKLLRAIEQKVVYPVGSQQPVQTDFRVIAATHRDLEQLVRSGDFRHDLYFRLAAFRIDVPPLRDRMEDIAPLARYFLATISKSPQAMLSEEALAELASRPWWGNVRELRNAIEHAVIVSRGGLIGVEHLPPPRPPIEPGREPAGETLAKLLREWTESHVGGGQAPGELYAALLRLVEVPVLETMLRKFAGQVAPAAKYLGLHRTTLRKKLEEYGLL